MFNYYKYYYASTTRAHGSIGYVSSGTSEFQFSCNVDFIVFLFQLHCGYGYDSAFTPFHYKHFSRLEECESGAGNAQELERVNIGTPYGKHLGIIAQLPVFIDLS